MTNEQTGHFDGDDELGALDPQRSEYGIHPLRAAEDGEVGCKTY